MFNQPELPIDPPREKDFDEEQEAREREGEIRHDMWQEDDYREGVNHGRPS